MNGWVDNPKCSESPVQLRFVAEAVQYVSYAYQLTTVKKNSTKIVPGLPLGFPLLGPRFIPPDYIHITKRSSASEIVPETAYIKPLNIVHPFYHPELEICPQCNSKKTKWQGWNTKGPRKIHGQQREEMAIGYQLECQDCKRRNGEMGPDDKKVEFCFATTSHKFWKSKSEWEIPCKRGHP